ncbi:MAG: hypothetical protein M3R08_06400, partial [Bacteroidota bacterium]|nr:hypothetical protein [Bacteroidota bacterium]
MTELWRTSIGANGFWLTISVFALATMLSLWPAILPVLLVLFLVQWWIKFPIDLHRNWRSPLPWMLILYMLHLIGMAWSTNWDYGLFDLQIKLPLLLVPLIGIMRPQRRRELLLPALLGLVIGNSLAVFAGAINVLSITSASDGPPLA